MFQNLLIHKNYKVLKYIIIIIFRLIIYKDIFIKLELKY